MDLIKIGIIFAAIIIVVRMNKPLYMSIIENDFGDINIDIELLGGYELVVKEIMQGAFVVPWWEILKRQVWKLKGIFLQML